MPSAPKDTRQFYSPLGELYCFAVIFALQVVLCFAQFMANKISLKPGVLITLLIYQKYHSVRKYRISLEKVTILQYSNHRGDNSGR